MQVEDTGQLLGIHVVAPNAELNDPNEPSFESWTILAETIIATLAQRMNLSLGLVP